MFQTTTAAIDPATHTEPRWLKRHLATVLEWLKRNLVIILIVAATVGGGIVLSVAAKNAHENLLTILTGLTLVASLAIFASAVTAAIYAKPAYDEAVTHLRPVDLELYGLTLRNELGEPITAAGQADGFDVYETSLPCTMLVQVSVQNVGRTSAYCIFNLRVPAECDITPIDPMTGHHQTTDERILRLMPRVFTSARYTAAEPQIARGAIVAYAAKVRIPRAHPSQKAWSMRPSSPWHPDLSSAHSLAAWPIQIVVRGFVEDEFAIDRPFLVRAPAQAEPEELAKGVERPESPTAPEA